LAIAVAGVANAVRERALKVADTRANTLIHRDVARRTRQGFIECFAGELSMEDSFSSRILLFIDHQLTLAVCLSVGQRWHNEKNDVTLRATALIDMLAAGCGQF
jgi:hypothetical protein